MTVEKLSEVALMYTPLKQVRSLVIKNKLVKVIPVLAEETLVQLPHNGAVTSLDTVSVYRVADVE
jgi:hypothetical protein